MNESNDNTELLPEEQQSVEEAIADEQSAPIAVAEAKPLPAEADKTPTPKKKLPVAAVITTVLACLVVVGGLFAVKNYLAPKPELIVRQALAATVSQQQKLKDDIYEAIPTAKRLFEPSEPAPSETSFDLTLRSIEGIDYEQLVSAMIADSGISGTVLTDCDSGSSIADITVSLKRKPLINAQLYISPELVTAAVPTFSDTILSIAPKSLAADYKSSIFQKASPMGDDELEMMQQLLVGELEYIKAIGGISYQKLIADITEIIKKPLETAVYSYDKKSGSYLVTLDGDAVKNAVCEYYRYLYVDSEIAPAMERLLMPLLTVSGIADGDYSSSINGLLNDIEGNIPPMETVITLDIDKGVIKKANITASPADEGGDIAVFTAPFVADITLTENGCGINMMFDMNDPANGSEMEMNVNADCVFSDGVYTISVKADAKSADSDVTVPLVITAAADGSYGITFGIDTTALNDNVKLDFSTNGSAALEEEFFTVELPSSRIEYAISGESANINGALVFDYRQSVSPLSEPLTAPDEHISVFSLNEQSLQGLIDEYTAGAKSLVGKLMSIFA